MRATKRRITLEYVLIKDKNDSMEDAQRLSKIAKRLKAKVNLIPCSPVCGKVFELPSKARIDIFKNVLIKNRVNATIRQSKGYDIQAACGQLAFRQSELA
jgi:23S rRNA (adenine2503-C2)-methyltransferase